MSGYKCPKCGGRVVNYDDYLGHGNGATDATKIFVTGCQICGWRKERIGDEMKNLSETIVKNSGLEECEECLTITKKLIDGLCISCYKREQNLASGRSQSHEDKDINGYFTDVLVCKRCDDEVAQLTDGLCDLCRDELKPAEDATADQKHFICADCDRERKHYALGLCSSCYQKSLRQKKANKHDAEPDAQNNKVVQISEKKGSHLPSSVVETDLVDIAPQKAPAEVPATDHPQQQNEMKSANEQSQKNIAPVVSVDDAAGVVFTLPKGCVQPLAEIYIHFFERDEGLLKQLNTAAELNRRTLANEILYRLDAAQ
ncbi:MAG: hypothetical protein L3J57_01580 [Desulfuromusa sp.]|nr:hypothetical protein [Desulfuromusa sp.]